MKRTTAIVLGGLVVAAGVGAGVAMAERGEGRMGWHGRDGMGMHGGDHRGMRGERGGHRGMFGRWGSREVTKDDFDERTRVRFARLDQNSDGVIDRAEIEAMVTDRMEHRGGGRGGKFGERMLKRMDADRDGKVTKEEMLARVDERFKQGDLTNDGRITEDDLPPMMRGRGVFDDDGGMRGRGGRMAGRLRAADANDDGAVTRDEMVAAAEQRFARFDRTGDGAIDDADRDALKKEMVDYQVKRFLHRFGADEAGQVTREQFQAEAGKRFAMRDTDGDGKLSGDEVGRGGKRGWGRHGGRHGHDGDRGGWHRGGPGADTDDGERGPGRGGNAQ